MLEGEPGTIVEQRSRSSMESSTPVTVMVFGVSQLADVNVTEAGTVPSDGSELARGIVTSAVGWLFRTAVKVAVPPASVVVRPEVGVIVTPAGEDMLRM